MAAAFLSPPDSKRTLALMADHSPFPHSLLLTDPPPSSTTKRSRQPLPFLVVPSGHAALSFLCHASLVGGFIGKSGSSIKQLRLDTASKIRVEDSLQPGSDDRVILIVAAATPFKRLRLQNGGDDEDEEEYEVSAAQEAAMRVFEKVLEVSAEVDGAAPEVVSCRLLVDALQAGSVIGKGGNVVEKLRRETGARIRVLFGQHLPPGVAPPNEVVEMEGEVLAVKRALLGVCGRLQECQLMEQSAVKESRPLESRVSPAEPDLHTDPLQFIAFSGATNPPSSALVGRPSSLEDGKDFASDTNPRQQEVVFKILCSNDRVGGVIGRGGSMIRALQEETGATISVRPSIPNCDERLVTITSMEDLESRYSPAQRAVILVFSRSVDAGLEKGLQTGLGKSSSITARLLILSSQVGCLLGKRGAIISEMRKATGTGIRILRGDQVPKCASEDDEVVEISGQFVNVQDALYEVTSRLRNNLIASKVINAPIHGRVGDGNPIVLRQSTGKPGAINGRATVRQGLDPFLYPHRLYHSSSPGFQKSEIADGGNPSTIADLGKVASINSGVEIGRGNRPAIVTNTTVEILVPESAVSSVYGENGSNLARIRQISGAKVTVHEPYPGSRDRTVIISGTPDETQAAQSLLHAFILTGPV